MKRKILLTTLLITSFIGIVTLVAAKSSTESIPVNYPEIKVLEGVALDKNTNETKQAVFLTMNYGGEKSIYLIIGKEIFNITEAGNASKPENGTQVIFYKSEDGSILTLLIQKFKGETSIAGEFKNYLITFRHRYRNCFELRENFGKQIVKINPGLGKVQKEVRSEVRKETRPVKGTWKTQIENINL